MMAQFKRIHGYFTHEIWKIRVGDLSFPANILLKAFKIVLLSVRGFNKDRSGIRATALTLYTLLSIVPVTALLFGISKGFGLEDRLEHWLLTQFPEQREILAQVVIFARRTLENAKGGLVAGAGVAFLMYSVLKVIGNIEYAFNDIWSIAKPRSWARKFSDYLSLTLVGPFLILGASSLNVYIATLVNRAAEAAPLSGIISPVARVALGLSPVLLLWILFTFLYSFLPNTKVPVVSALIGGALSAVLYQTVQSVYIGVQVGVSKNNAIYGSFAALPLFIIWLQISWHIVLMGAEVTHYHQNFESNEREEHHPDLSFRAVKRLSLRVYGQAARRFLEGLPPQTVGSMGEELRVPSRVLTDITRRLALAGILSEVGSGDSGEIAYQPARDPHGTGPFDILKALETTGEELSSDEGQGSDKYLTVLDEFDRSLKENPANLSFGNAATPREGGREPGRT